VPKIRRHNLPPPLYAHLLDRIQDRHISARQLRLLLRWMDTQPEVPNRKWFKRFPEMIVCGEGELIKTFLVPSQAPTGALDCPAELGFFSTIEPCTTGGRGWWRAFGHSGRAQIAAARRPARR
jgi:hypothetical protein